MRFGVIKSAAKLVKKSDIAKFWRRKIGYKTNFYVTLLLLLLCLYQIGAAEAAPTLSRRFLPHAFANLDDAVILLPATYQHLDARGSHALSAFGAQRNQFFDFEL